MTQQVYEFHLPHNYLDLQGLVVLAPVDLFDLTLLEEGFEIDSQNHEATFYYPLESYSRFLNEINTKTF